MITGVIPFYFRVMCCFNTVKLKILVLAILAFTCIQANAQRDSTFRLRHTVRYKHVTLKIIKYLGIPFRNSYLKDGRLMFAIDKPSGFGERSPAFGMFIRGKYMFRPVDTLNVFYPNPIIYISKNVFNDLHNSPRTSERYFRALSSVVHEITHYYQHINYNYVSYWSTGDYHAYFCQPYERDAYSVEAFFYLSKMKPRSITKLLATHVGDNDQLKRLLVKQHSFLIKRPILCEASDVNSPWQSCN